MTEKQIKDKPLVPGDEVEVDGMTHGVVVMARPDNGNLVLWMPASLSIQTWERSRVVPTGRRVSLP